jgi:ABC-type transport system involved in cytochrome c biogenesis permease component
MTFLPIVARELRVAARRRGTYWVRTGAATAVIVLGMFFFLTMQQQAPREMAMALFGIMTGSAVLSALLSGVRSTADCLSEEKREGTLGLLFLTDLKGYDVVIGKLAANSLNAFYGVVAAVPILAIPLLLGGVTAGEFGRMALVAVNTLFFSLAVGLGVSAMSRSARKAIGMTFLLLLGFTAVLPACGVLVALYASSRQFHSAFLLPSPGYSFGLAFDMNYRAGAAAFWTSMAVINGLAWVFLGLACVVAPRIWQDKPAGVRTLRWRELWQNWSYGNLAERSAFRRRLLGINAFFWLTARARLKPACVWAVLGLIACGWAWGASKYHRDWMNAATYVATGLGLNLLLKCWFASETGRQLAEDRKHGALELLLSTPLTVKEILRGQRLALQRQFLGPLLVVLAVFLIFMLATLSEVGAVDDRQLCASFWLAAMLMLVADLTALYWVGMWQGLTARNPNRATSANLIRVLLLPWAGMALVFLAVTVGALTGAREPSWKFFLGWWVALGLAADIGFGAWARQRLLSEFREAAEQRYASRPGLWKRLAGRGAESSFANR